MDELDDHLTLSCNKEKRRHFETRSSRHPRLKTKNVKIANYCYMYRADGVDGPPEIERN